MISCGRPEKRVLTLLSWTMQTQLDSVSSTMVFDHIVLQVCTPDAKFDGLPFGNVVGFRWGDGLVYIPPV